MMMKTITLLIVCVFYITSAKPTTTTKDSATSTDESFDLDSFFGAAGDGHFANMEVDGVETMMPKKTEKMPGQKRTKSEFVQDIGVVPSFTGSFVTEESTKQNKKESSDEDSDVDYFGEASGPVTNPASTYLEGADFEKVAQPKCQMLGCTGPIPNDGSYATLSTALEGKACSQIFVAMNGCTDNKGYPMGMLCSVCCDCANSFVAEMKKTFGYKSNLATSTFSS